MMPTKRINSVCPRDCYDSCSVIVELKKVQQTSRIKGDRVHPITRGFLCPRGSKDIERVFSEQRVLFPHIRHKNSRDEAFQRVSWNDALVQIVERLQQVINENGAQAVLHLEYAGNIGSLTWYYPQRLWNALGATKTDNSICSKSGHEAITLHYGSSYGLQTEYLINHQLIVFWGFNAAVSSPHIWNLSIQARHQNRTQLIVIDPRESESAQKVDIWIQPNPGTDVALAYGVARALIEQELIDKGFIQKWTKGFDQYQEEVMKWTPDRVEKITGVSWSEVEGLAAIYGELQPNVTLIGLGMQKSLQGAEAVRAVSLIPALLGSHRGFFYSNGRAYPIDYSYLTGESLTDNPCKIVSQVDLGRFMENGEFKFVYIYNMNPALTLPNQKAFRRGLSRDDVFVAVHDTHWTETTRYADVVLPAPTYLEKEDLVVPWGHHFVQISKRAFDPLEESKSETWVMQQLIQLLQLQLKWLFEDPWEAVERALEKAIEKGGFSRLQKGERLKLQGYVREKFPTPSSKIEFVSSVAKQYNINPLPVQLLLEKTEDEFILLNSATPKYTHTQFRDVYGPIPVFVWINPEDAKTLSIKTDDLIILENTGGQIQVKAKVVSAVPQGVLWAPRQFIGINNKPQNCLMPASPQQIGKGSTFNSAIVQIKKL